MEERVEKPQSILSEERSVAIERPYQLNKEIEREEHGETAEAKILDEDVVREEEIVTDKAGQKEKVEKEEEKEEETDTEEERMEPEPRGEG